MKKLLIASTALSLAGGAAFAEMAFTLDGDAKMGVDYNSEATGGKSKHEFKHEIGVDFTGSGTTDGGLTFGASAGFDVSDKAINTGTVHVSGSFGTLTIGGNDAADLTAGGTNDVGLFDIGVDDKAEGLRGTTAAQLRYDNTFGQISIAISAGTSAAVEAMDPVTKTVSIEIPGSSANEWYLVDLDDVLYVFDDRERVDSRYDSIYNVVRAADSVTIDHDSDGSPSANINGFADVLNEDGTPKTNEDGEVIPTADPTATTIVDVDDAGQIAAYNVYRKYYDFGKDRRVGGVNPAAGATGDRNADVGDVVGDNEVKPGTYTDDVVVTEAVEGKDSETQYAFGMSFEAGGVTIGVGYDSNKTVSMGAGFSAGEISTNLLYVKTDEEHPDGEATGIGADMKYTMGASAVTLSYGRRKPEMGEATDAVGMGVTHSLGGDATMSAGFGKVDESNKASIGLSFKF